MTQEVGGWKEKTPPAVRWPENAHLGTIVVSELEDPERTKPPSGRSLREGAVLQGGGGPTEKSLKGRRSDGGAPEGRRV